MSEETNEKLSGAVVGADVQDDSGDDKIAVGITSTESMFMVNLEKELSAAKEQSED